MKEIRMSNKQVSEIEREKSRSKKKKKKKQARE